MSWQQNAQDIASICGLDTFHIFNLILWININGHNILQIGRLTSQTQSQIL